MTRVAAVDCGTNSVRLLVADVDAASGTLTDVDRRMEVVRLGEGVDRTGRFSTAALERTQLALRRYAEVIRECRAERVRMVATSATRDAANRGEFVASVLDILGVEPEVISGGEEATLSFTGATRGLADPGADPCLVVDIGGGSTEFVLGRAGEGSVRSARSVDVGCVRLTERHLHDDPPTARQVAAARADVEAAIEEAAADVALGDARTLVGLAGSVTTVTAMALGLAAYEPARIHRAHVPASRVREIAGILLAMPRAERAALPFMHPGRVDVIGAGALVWAAVVERVGLPEVVASEHDILDGIAWSVAARADLSEPT
jgi:exopolyphosphatase/guanosine-5'-triphosphate,3'-diphosphate pyrophosphatase